MARSALWFVCLAAAVHASPTSVPSTCTALITQAKDQSMLCLQQPTDPTAGFCQIVVPEITACCATNSSWQGIRPGFSPQSWTSLHSACDNTYRRAANATGPPTCKLISSSFSYVVQAVLGLLAFGSLLIKWQSEIPKRPAMVWVLDSSKQAFSGVCAHVSGMLIATIISSYGGEASECAWYFVVFCIDTTVGVFLAYVFLKALQHVAGSMGWDSLAHTGDYGQLGSASGILYMVWLKQMMAWCVLVVLARVCCGGVVVVTEALLALLAEGLDSLFEGHPKALLAFVMLACPIGMNVLQLWMQDGFLKKTVSEHVSPYDLVEGARCDEEAADCL